MAPPSPKKTTPAAAATSSDASAAPTTVIPTPTAVATPASTQPSAADLSSAMADVIAVLNARDLNAAVARAEEVEVEHLERYVAPPPAAWYAVLAVLHLAEGDLASALHVQRRAGQANYTLPAPIATAYESLRAHQYAAGLTSLQTLADDVSDPSLAQVARAARAMVRDRVVARVAKAYAAVRAESLAGVATAQELVDEYHWTVGEGGLHALDPPAMAHDMLVGPGLTTQLALASPLKSQPDPDTSPPPARFTATDWQTWTAAMAFALVWVELANILPYAAPTTRPATLLGRIRASIHYYFARILTAIWPLAGTGRTPAALAALSLLIATRIVTPADVYAAQKPATTVTLAALFVILGRLDELGWTRAFVRILTKPLTGNSSISGTSLLARVSLISAVLGATVMNDGAALFMAHAVADLLRRIKGHKVDAVPFALAIVTSANLGSAALLIGNPKVLLVTEAHKLGFGEYAMHLVVPVAVTVGANTGLLAWKYRAALGGVEVPDLTRVEEGSHDDDDALSDDDSGSSTAADHSRATTVAVGLDDRVSETRVSLHYGSDADDAHHALLADWTGSAPHATGAHERDARRCLDRPCRHWTHWTATDHDLDRAPHEFPAAVAHMPRPEDPVDPPLGLVSLVRDWVAENHAAEGPSASQAAVVRAQIDAERALDSRRGLAPVSPVAPKRLPTSRRDWWRAHGVHVAVALILTTMYTALFLRFDVALTSLAAAIAVIAVPHILAPTTMRLRAPSAAAVDPVHWSLLEYLFALLVVMYGISTTAIRTLLARAVRAVIESPVLGPPGSFRAAAGGGSALGLVILGMCAVLTSVPVVLVVAPVLEETKGGRLVGGNGGEPGEYAWYVLCWTVSVAGNVAPYGSVAGLIVAEVLDEGREGDEGLAAEWPAWFAAWSTAVHLVAGTAALAGVAKVLAGAPAE
ncbi:hypothetical protein GGF31_008545 [Allomyces arbusculus]|nr:hypothetical protein GGF31_008545 [Allomyces arbusculus]